VIASSFGCTVIMCLYLRLLEFVILTGDLSPCVVTYRKPILQRYSASDCAGSVAFH
jgi:hypothetical protein